LQCSSNGYAEQLQSAILNNWQGVLMQCCQTETVVESRLKSISGVFADYHIMQEQALLVLNSAGHLCCIAQGTYGCLLLNLK